VTRVAQLATRCVLGTYPVRQRGTIAVSARENGAVHAELAAHLLSQGGHRINVVLVDRQNHRLQLDLNPMGLQKFNPAQAATISVLTTRYCHVRVLGRTVDGNFHTGWRQTAKQLTVFPGHGRSVRENCHHHPGPLGLLVDLGKVRPQERFSSRQKKP
jgi:hypothetical protein